MKDLLVQLLTLILQLMRVPKDDTESADKLKKKIGLKRDEISTFHGDHETCEPEVTDILDDIAEVASTSEPDGEYAEVPDDIDDDLDEEAGDDVPGETREAKKKSKKKANPDDKYEECDAEDETEEEQKEQKEEAEAEEEAEDEQEQPKAKKKVLIKKKK